MKFGKSLILSFFMLFVAFSCGACTKDDDSNKYTVTFMTENVVYQTKKVEFGGKVSKPAVPFYYNYLFEGWLYEGEEWLFDSNIVSNDITLTAKFDYGYVCEGTKVTGLSNHGETLDKLYIREGVTEIDTLAFSSCTNLKEVALANTVNKISENAFSGCSELKTVTFGKNSQLTRIEKEAFFGTKLENIKLPEGLLFIGQSAFKESGSANTFDLVIPNSVESIGESAFEFSTISSIIISNSVTAIPQYTFYKCNSLETVIFADNSQLISIGHQAFFSNNNLKSVDFGKNSKLETLGDKVFASCYKLKNIIFPNSLTSMGIRTFYDCREFESITFESDSHLKVISSETFYLCKKLESIVIPSSVIEIGADAFYHCDNLGSVVFEDNSALTNLVDNIFSYCTNLTTVDFGENSELLTIGYSAFYNCNLKNVVIPHKVTTIGAYAFADNINIINITLPETLVFVDESAFDNCGINNVYYDGTIEKWIGIEFADETASPFGVNVNFYVKNGNGEYEKVS